MLLVECVSLAKRSLLKVVQRCFFFWQAREKLVEHARLRARAKDNGIGGRDVCAEGILIFVQIFGVLCGDRRVSRNVRGKAACDTMKMFPPVGLVVVIVVRCR